MNYIKPRGHRAHAERHDTWRARSWLRYKDPSNLMSYF